MEIDTGSTDAGKPLPIAKNLSECSLHWSLIRSLQIFAVPKTARRAKPFVDHVVSFSIADNRVWFRNYQIVHNAPVDLSAPIAGLSEQDLAAQLASQLANKGKKSKHAEDSISMNEIGPRFVLTPIKIFEGSFGGAVVWENEGKHRFRSLGRLPALLTLLFSIQTLSRPLPSELP